ncbi:acylphosphatase [Usitatibacter palustris]|uniref:acylphosphatase n=1 Tax=Usitatibacter palustris TaxID=2732487 RepID=A0A6M4H4T9_9PROT|nr:acylphosphatase [Usitatibacter palustris]QJR14510.1 Acylphosphatase [Usitatibacter palustris]
MATSERVCRHLSIHGRVQGVWYRESMRQFAESRAITGWVRNRMDGSVEAMVQGAPEAVEAIIRWAHRGPEAAQVDRVDVSAGDGDFPTFEKRTTG